MYTFRRCSEWAFVASFLPISCCAYSWLAIIGRELGHTVTCSSIGTSPLAADEGKNRVKWEAQALPRIETIEASSCISCPAVDWAHNLISILGFRIFCMFCMKTFSGLRMVDTYAAKSSLCCPTALVTCSYHLLMVCGTFEARWPIVLSPFLSYL